VLAAPSRAIVIGLARGRASGLEPILRAYAQGRVFVHDVASALAHHPGPHDDIIVWGAAMPTGLCTMIGDTGARLVRIEAGFIGAAELQSHRIVPRSLVFDPVGIHYDATGPSRLETLLAWDPPDATLCARAAALRTMIVAHAGHATHGRESLPRWHNPRERPVVLVPGQMETEDALVLTSGSVRTDRALLEIVRTTRPDAFIVYVPHPATHAPARAARRSGDLRALADHIATDTSVGACLAFADEVHTMTSLHGFDALLRGLRVVTYGAPFYAGWGLTEDRAIHHPAWARRGRHLTLDQLCAAALLRYPRYWDPVAQCFDTPERTVMAIASESDRSQAALVSLRQSPGFWFRQAHKARALARDMQAGIRNTRY
jgi:capsular polysaccharide export protein